VPDAAYSIVDLDNLNPSGPLAGPYVAIGQLDDPVTTPADASHPLLFDRSQPQFHEVNAYFQLDRAQKYLISLGYSGSRRLINYQLPCDPHALNGDDNSYYLRGFIPGQGQLLFGDGGTPDAEDSDIILHEFGHVIQDWISPATFTGPSSTTPPAIGEGFADYWSFSQTYAATAATGRDPFCIADWDARCAGDDPSKRCSYPAGADCLRRVDGTKTMADYINSNNAGTEHKNGEIWSSALREIFMSLTARFGFDAGKRTADTTILEGTFGMPPNPTYATMAKKLIAADGALNGGANLQVICTAVTTRGILQAGDCTLSPHGEQTVIPPNDEGGPIPDNDTTGITLRTVVLDSRSIDKLYVDVDIQHTSRGDLALTLIAPDGTTVHLLQPSLDRTPNVRATFGLDAPSIDSLDVFHGRSAAGEWKLFVQDLRPHDSGSVRSWSLRIQFVGDAPSNDRPASFAPSKFIAAVAHAAGANGTNFITDVHVFNRSDHIVNASLVFTPSGQEGWGHFAAVKLQLAPRQTAVLNDIVGRTMETSGTGNLDVVGEVQSLLITSRTYTTSDHGTFGQFIPAELNTTGIRYGDLARVILPLRNDPAFRSNFGFSEVDGGSGSVRVVYFDAAGTKVGQSDYPAVPFGHTQNLITATGVARAEVSVTSGNARVLAYGSMVDNQTGDGIYVDAQPPASTDLSVFAAPAIHSDGVNGTAWRTDVWLSAGDAPATALLRYGQAQAVFPVDAGATQLVGDVVKSSFFSASVGLLRFNIFGGTAVANTRTWTDTGHGSYGTAIPFVPTASALAPGAQRVDVIHLESSSQLRTNIGIMEVDGNPAVARVIVYDAAGREVGRGDVAVGGRSVSQIALRSLTAATLYGARVSVQNVGISGRIIAYGSVVDNLSGDPIYIPAQ
jgi:subtilisin-like proprotein convertase family protein